MFTSLVDTVIARPIRAIRASIRGVHADALYAFKRSRSISHEPRSAIPPPRAQTHLEVLADTFSRVKILADENSIRLDFLADRSADEQIQGFFSRVAQQLEEKQIDPIAYLRRAGGNPALLHEIENLERELRSVNAEVVWETRPETLAHSAVPSDSGTTIRIHAFALLQDDYAADILSALKHELSHRGIETHFDRDASWEEFLAPAYEAGLQDEIRVRLIEIDYQDGLQSKGIMRSVRKDPINNEIREARLDPTLSATAKERRIRETVEKRYGDYLAEMLANDWAATYLASDTEWAAELLKDGQDGSDGRLKSLLRSSRRRQALASPDLQAAYDRLIIREALRIVGRRAEDLTPLLKSLD